MTLDLNDLATPGIYRISAGVSPRNFETEYRGDTMIHVRDGRPTERTWWEHKDGKHVATWKKFGDREWVRNPTKTRVLLEHWAATLEQLGSHE